MVFFPRFWYTFSLSNRTAATQPAQVVYMNTETAVTENTAAKIIFTILKVSP